MHTSGILHLVSYTSINYIRRLRVRGQEVRLKITQPVFIGPHYYRKVKFLRAYNLTYSHLQCRQTAFFDSRKQPHFGACIADIHIHMYVYVYAQTFFTQVRSLLSSLSSLFLSQPLAAFLRFLSSKHICIPSIGQLHFDNVYSQYFICVRISFC